MESELGRLISLREVGFSYQAVAVHESSTVMRVWKQHWRAPNNSINWQWATEGDVGARRSTLAPHGDERPFSFFRQLAAHWYSAAGVLMSPSSDHWSLLHRGQHAKEFLYRIPLMANHWRLSLPRAHEHRIFQTDWIYFDFLDESVCGIMMIEFFFVYAG